MARRRHRRYSTEFKLQLIQAYLDGEGSVRAISGRHGSGTAFSPSGSRNTSEAS